MDYSKLRGLIRAYFPTQAAFAAAMGISECSLSQKLNNHSEWTGKEMGRAAELLHFPADEIPIYFFTPDVEISQRKGAQL
jgi:transcriptional regulator with XRE-family HTH domain